MIGTSFAIGQPVLALLIAGALHCQSVALPCRRADALRTEEQRHRFPEIGAHHTLDPLSSFCWHMNWHLEHHMFAGVPCYNLKALHQAGR